MTSFRALITALSLVAAAPAAAQVGRTPGVLDPNLAAESELAALPHASKALASAIVAGRPYLRPSAFDAVVSRALTTEQKKEFYARCWLHLNLNTGSRAEILLIPGVGDRMVGEFLEYRPYKGLAQFDKEIGKYVKPDELARLRGYVFVPVDLNTASDASLLSIPGMGPRMLGEFKEYRPYKRIVQFRREIGKYVDEDEVARLERYLTIR